MSLGGVPRQLTFAQAIGYDNCPCPMNKFIANGVETGVVFVATPPLATGTSTPFRFGMPDADRVGGVAFSHWANVR
jgi:hypothetical protein